MLIDVSAGFLIVQRKLRAELLDPARERGGRWTAPVVSAPVTSLTGGTEPGSPPGLVFRMAIVPPIWTTVNAIVKSNKLRGVRCFMPD